VDSVQLASRDVQVAGNGAPPGKTDDVEAIEQLACRVVLTNANARFELDALFGHLVDSTLDDELLQLEVGDA
jgi:hypothetical protein